MSKARSNRSKHEFNAHYNDEIWDDSHYSDSENDIDSGNDDMNAEKMAPENMVVDLAEEIAAALSKNKRRSKGRKVRKQRASVEHPTNKGKAILLPLSERIGDVGLQEDDQPTRHSLCLKMPKETIHEFISQHEIVQSDGVSIANSAPASFTVDLRPPHSNNVKDGFCHLLFETDYDPDAMFESTDHDYCNVQVTPYSDEKTVQAMSESLFGLVVPSFPEESTTEVLMEEIVSTARISATEFWRGQGDLYHKVKPESVDKKETRNFNICKDLAKKIGMRSSSYSNVDNLRHSAKSPGSEPDEDYDFEIVPDITNSAEECGLCHRLFGERDYSGNGVLQNIPTSKTFGAMVGVQESYQTSLWWYQY